MKSLLCLIVTWSLAGLVSSAEDINSALKGSFKGPVGLQLYSYRDSFSKDVPGTLDKIKALGFVDVELAGNYNQTPEKFHELLASKGLKAIAGHFPYDRFKNDPEGVAAEAMTFGMSYAGCPYVPHKGVFTDEDARETAKVFNNAGKALASHGLKFYYHPHGYEFEPAGSGTVFDTLVAATDPKYVSYEMDVMWIIVPGQDPVALLNKYGPRWKLMHLKDPKKGSKSVDVTLGAGQADWPAILKASQKAGIKYYFIEDESKAVVEQMPQHLEYLKNVSW